MKHDTQVCVKDSLEAARTYCRTFGAEITLERKNEAGTAYEHCVLSVDGEGFLAIGEASIPCDVRFVQEHKWQTMTFNVFEMGSGEAVLRAFRVLSEGGAVIEPIHEVPWSACFATVIDRYGVCWRLSV